MHIYVELALNRSVKHRLCGGKKVLDNGAITKQVRGTIQCMNAAVLCICVILSSMLCVFILHNSLHSSSLVLPPPCLTDSPFDPLWFVNELYRSPAHFHRLTPNKRFEPVSSTVIVAVCSLFNRMLSSTNLIPVHLLHCGRTVMIGCNYSLLLNRLEQSAIFTGLYVTCRASIAIGKNSHTA